MKKLLLIAFTFIYSFNSYAQIKFVQGYFIDNKDSRTECLIKDVDWRKNPTEFEYKLSESADPVKATIVSVKQFGLLNASKYTRFSVNIDRSRHELDRLNTQINPEFNEEVLFLKTIVDGPADLYVYVDGSLERFFYSVDGADVKQLIYKSYLTADNRIGKNQGFRQQLWVDLNCGKLTMREAESTNYTIRDLIRYFLKYNSCIDPAFVESEEQQKRRSLFNLSIKPGLDYASLSIQHRVSDARDINYGENLNFRLGVEAEYVLPFNKNKWAVLTEPAYRYFKAEKEEGNQNLDVDYQSIELPVGLRHNFFLDDKSTLFINGFYVVDIAFGTKLEFVHGTELDDLVFKPGKNVALGLGYKHNSKYSVEFRYFTMRRVFEDTYFWASKYNNVSIILGYKLF